MKPLVIANLKCHPSRLKEARELFISLKRRLKSMRKVRVVICPPHLYIPELIKIFGRNNQKIKFGAQNCFWEEGAFTGEISPMSLKDIGVDFVIVGHSERRRIFFETDEMINRKLKAILAIGLSPILCVGETMEERKAGKTFQVLSRELKEDLRKIPAHKASKVILAYEPLWAIGTKKPCLANEVMTEVLSLRKIIARLYHKKVAEEIRVLYGGSIDKNNIDSYTRISGLDGFLVGGAALDPEDFVGIVDRLGQSDSTR